MKSNLLTAAARVEFHTRCAAARQDSASYAHFDVWNWNFLAPAPLKNKQDKTLLRDYKLLF